jgi:hypothetical protein
MGRKQVLLSTSVIGILLSSTALLPPPSTTILLRWTTISFHYCTLSLCLVPCDKSRKILQLYSVFTSVASFNDFLLRCAPFHFLRSVSEQSLSHCRRFVGNVNVIWPGVTIVRPRASSIAGCSPLKNVIHCKTLCNAAVCPIPFQDVVHFRKFATAERCTLQDAVQCKRVSTAQRWPVLDVGCWRMQDTFHCRTSTSGPCPLQDVVHFRTLSTAGRCSLHDTINCGTLYSFSLAYLAQMGFDAI